MISLRGYQLTVGLYAWLEWGQLTVGIHEWF